MKFSKMAYLFLLVGFAYDLSIFQQRSAGNLATKAGTQPLPELLPREKEVEMALSAAPEHLRKGAAVYVLERNGFVKVKDSTNGFTCIVNRDHPLNQKPVCFDAEGTATILPKILRVGELLMRGQSMSEIDAESCRPISDREVHLATPAWHRLYAFRRYSEFQSTHRKGGALSTARDVLRAEPNERSFGHDARGVGK